MNTDRHELLVGSIERFLFQSADDTFAIFIVATPHELVTAKGSIPGLQVGQEVQLRGAWLFHAKFGKQFEVTECVMRLPTTITGLKKFLGSGLIKGIGATYAERLVNHFGLQVLAIIDQSPVRLAEVPGVGQKRIEQIIAGWKDQKEIASLMVFLQDKGISPVYAAKIYKQYRHQAVPLLLENPYRLADDIWGIGFKKADEIAHQLGVAPDSPKRIAAGILFSISQEAQQGHLYVELQRLRQLVTTILALTPGDDTARLIKTALHDLYSLQKIALHSQGDVHYVTLASYRGAERGVAEKLNKLRSCQPLRPCDLDAVYAQLRSPSAHDVELNEDQQRGILMSLQHTVSIITGGPGTGKTTLVKQLLRILEKEHIKYKLAAPTGRAAKRMCESTQRFATTVHRLLEFDPATMRFVHNETNALSVEVLIVDEASMLDIFLAHAIVRAMPYGARLIFIGDVDQLPSVGPGNFLRDCIASGQVPTTRLQHIFRQAQDSMIVVNAHRVNRGEFPIPPSAGTRSDFMFIKEENPENIVQHLKRLFFIELKKQGISLDDAMVLVPMNRGAAGTHALNHHLQAMLNPGPQEGISVAGVAYQVGDKVMQIRNNYDKHVFNGDIGVIVAVAKEDRQLTVNFGDKDIVYECDELHELVLAYAITIHKSQGSEYGAVIIPIFMQHFTLLQKNLIYTAITRAKKLCIIIGQPKALAIGLRATKGTERVTFLKSLLKSDSF